MSKESSPASDAMWFTIIAVLLSFIAAVALWGLTVLLTDSPASTIRAGITAVLTGVYLSHYIHFKAAKE